MTDHAVRPSRDEIISNEQLEMSMTILKTLADPARLQMLSALSKSDHSLSELSQFVGVSPSVASQLLAPLRAKEVLQSRKDGRHVIYSMSDERLKEFIAQTLDFAAYRLAARDPGNE
ncbi:metalloregulator ArsR/SmtB family transcription factor [Glutamicibacter sp. MNS18]|uniref:ArsR/SmtB family transcription factor n=1 Tax=Glutamicibacter sp. MNS18 TaxID=2989817 RepID=UPI0022359ADF|nr:metalloregulator ArsR/SmtB family transcription factor [Glutamicibacter sp. MNS18]MCW4464878.1 metalloregulator ArsR/SmtB family transcription factor [Glutamicibacter sp. MNS18]